MILVLVNIWDSIVVNNDIYIYIYIYIFIMIIHGNLRQQRHY